MKINIANNEIVTMAKMETMINPSLEAELSELRTMLADQNQRARFVRMWNETKGIVVVDNNDSFEVEINFAPIGAGGVVDFTIELIKDALNEFLPDYKSGKLLTKYAEKKLEAFGEKWVEKVGELAERLRKPNEELFTGEQLKLMEDYMSFRCKEVLNNPSLVALPTIASPEFGEAYAKFVKREKEFLRDVGLGRVRREDGTLETLESFCARAK